MSDACEGDDGVGDVTGCSAGGGSGRDAGDEESERDGLEREHFVRGCELIDDVSCEDVSSVMRYLSEA